METPRRIQKNIDGILTHAQTTPYDRTKYANFSKRNTKKHTAPQIVSVHLAQIVHAPAPAPEALSTNTKKTKPKYSLRTIVINSAAGFVFLTGVATSIYGWHINKAVATQATTLAAQTTNAKDDSPLNEGDVPSEDLGTDYSQLLANHRVAANEPKIITIPKLNVKSRILNIGLTDSGAIQTPNNVFDTGWYNKSAMPGQPGATFIDGHVHGITKPGVFYGLKNLVAGDEIIVTKGDDTTLSYRVVSAKNYPADSVDMRETLTPVSDKSGLNLMTCNGRYNAENGYSERLVVFSELIE
jgi:sortase (surface protein transpeptidase)